MIHDKNSKNKLIGELILALSPLLIFALYKNGYMLYQKNLINFSQIFLIFYLSLISFGIYELGSLIFRHKLSFDYDLIHFLIMAFLVSPNVYLGIYSLVLALCFILFQGLKKLNFNHIALMKLLIMGIMYANKQYTYLNLLEQNFHYDYSIWDKLLGFQVGGLATSSVVLIFIIFIY